MYMFKCGKIFKRIGFKHKEIGDLTFFQRTAFCQYSNYICGYSSSCLKCLHGSKTSFGHKP